MIETVYFQITNNCNFRCRHCAADGGPGGRTMTGTDIEKALNHLPTRLKNLVISGGEVFTIKDILFQTLAYIQNYRRRLFPNVELHVQTNGFWIKNDRSDVETLRTLYEYGVNHLAFSGMDGFHEEQGLWTELVESAAINAGRILKRELGGIETFEFIFYGCRKGLAAPFRRASLLPESLLRPKLKCDLPLGSSITIGQDGEAFLCCWKESPSIGSVLSSPLEELVDKAAAHPVIGELMRKGPLGAAVALGVYDPGKDEAYRNRACIICKGLFAGLKLQ